MLSSENVALRTENESLISARPVNGKMLIKKHGFKETVHLFRYVWGRLNTLVAIYWCSSYFSTITMAGEKADLAFRSPAQRCATFV